MGDEEAHDRRPELLMLERQTDPRPQERAGEPIVAPEVQDQRPAEGGGDVQVGGGADEVVRLLLGQRDGEVVRRADVPPARDVLVPRLVLDRLGGQPRQPGGVQEGGDLVAGDQVPQERGELAAGVVAARPPGVERSDPVAVVGGQGEQGVGVSGRFLGGQQVGLGVAEPHQATEDLGVGRDREGLVLPPVQGREEGGDDVRLGADREPGGLPLGDRPEELLGVAGEPLGLAQDRLGGGDLLRVVDPGRPVLSSLAHRLPGVAPDVDQIPPEP